MSRIRLAHRLGALCALFALLTLGGCGGEEQADERERERSRAEKPSGKVKDPTPKEARTGQDQAESDPSGTTGIPPRAKRTTVLRVVDGDTVELEGLGSSRLIGVDTPEVYGGVECYGREASEFAKQHLVPGEAVHYLYGAERTDRYGRALVYLWLSGGTFFNASLVAEGYAVPLSIAPNVEHAERFRRLAGRARSADRGLWSPSTCGGETDQPAGGSRGGGGGSAGVGSGGSGGSGSSGGGGCEPGYEPCVPRNPPDVNCDDVDGPIQVSGSDPHGLDGDGDGTGCQ